VLVRGLNWRACCCPSKVGTILPKVSFIATIVAPAVTFYAWTSTAQVRASTDVALNSALLWRKAPRLLRLMVGSIIQSPLLLMPGLGPRRSTDPLRRLWALTFHLTLHLLHHSGLLHQSGKVLDGQGSHH